MTSYLRDTVPYYIFYGILRGDNSKLFKLKVWYFIYRRCVEIIWNCGRTNGYIEREAKKHGYISDWYVATTIGMN